jgi:hypothetical protein
MREYVWDGDPNLRAKAEEEIRKSQAVNGNGAGHSWADERDDPLICEPLTPIPIKELPPRQWAYGKFLLFGEASGIGAVDGGGKGTHTVAIALSMITGRSLLGERVWRTGPVAIISYEDSKLEWQKRIAAACLHYGIDYEEVIGKFYFIRKSRGRVRFAANSQRGGDVIFPDGDAIISYIKQIGAVLLVVDPFNHAHSLLDGNSNALIAQVAHEISRVAKESNVAALVLHHLRKGSAGDPDDFMGAVALRATFRSVRIFTRMLAEQGQQLKIPHNQVWRYSRIAGSKENYAPPPEFTTWYELKSVQLDNAEGIYEEGDNIGVATVWDAPDVFEGLNTTAIAEIFDAVRKAPGDGLRWAPDLRSEEWIGNIIRKKTGKSDDDCLNIIHAWIGNSVLISDKYRHPKQRKMRDYVELNEAKAAEILNGVYFQPETE